MKIINDIVLLIRKFLPLKLIYTFLGTLTLLTSGMVLGWPSPSLPKLPKEYPGLFTTNDESSWMAIMPLLGALIGCPIVALIVDVIGRKKTIILSIFLYFTNWIMLAFSKSQPLLYTARFIAGIADGLVYTAVPSYVGEIADPGKRGLLEAAGSVAVVSGVLLINVIGLYFSISITALVCSLLPVGTLISFLWMPESPYYFLMQDKPNAARKSLEILRGVEDVNSELDRLNVAVEEQCSNSGKFLELFTVQSNRRALYIVVVLRATQKFSGIEGVIFYTQDIFKEVYTDVQLKMYTTIFFSVQVVSMIISSGIVDKVGRKPLLILSTVVTGLALCVEATYFYLKTNTNLNVSRYYSLGIVDLIGYVGFFGLGLGTVPLLCLGELFPTNVKAFALCLAEIYYSIVAAVATKCFQMLKDCYGIHIPFYISALCCAMGLIAIVIIVPETKGKTLEEIQESLKGDSEQKVNAIELDTKIFEEPVPSLENCV